MTSVVHVITTLNRGGAENQLFTLAREQVRSGINVIVIPIKGSNELESDFKKHNISIDNSLLNQNILKQFFLITRITHGNSSTFHAHLPRAELLVALSRIKKKNFVVSRHNAEKFFPKAPRLVSLVLARFVSARASKIIAISFAVRNFLIDSFEIPKKKSVSVVYYGINDDLTNRNKSFPENKALTFGTIARLVPQKDIPTLLRAFSFYLREYYSSKLIIIGSGYLLPELIALCDELGIAKSVEWVGKVSDIPSNLEMIDIFLLTSTYEGFGLVLLEAMQNGVPVIAANNSAIPEVLGSDKGNLFDTGDEGHLSMLMKRYSNRLEWERLQQQGYERLKYFKPDLMKSKIDEVYLL